MKNLFFYCVVLTLVFSFFTNPSHARRRAGVEFKDSITIEGNKLKLNGLAMRTKRVLFFNYRIYVAGLYLPEKCQNGEAILASDTPRHLVTHFLHSRVSRRQLTDAWKESFKRHKYEGEKVDKFLAFHPRDLRKGEKMIFTYIPGKGTKVSMKGKVCGTIPGKKFADALFSIYISKDAGLRRIRDDLLGK